MRYGVGSAGRETCPTLLKHSIKKPQRDWSKDELIELLKGHNMEEHFRNRGLTAILEVMKAMDVKEYDWVLRKWQ